MCIKKMKICFVLATLLALVIAQPIEEKINGENGWYVPQVDGSFEWVSKEQAAHLEKKSQLMQGRLDLNAVTFYLYTKSNPTEGQKIDANEKSIAESHFNKDHPTRFTIHGWTGSYTDSLNKDIAEAWLSKGEYNIIVVDWARARLKEYASAVLAVPGVGNKVGEFIQYLHESHGMSLDSLEVIGHSLGAHVSGYAGKTVGEGQIHTIVGLDPAFPLFSYDNPSKRLSSTDAFYVESIQTNGGKLGFLKPIGKGAFYPNGGQSQPGCGVDLTGSCSHSRSYAYYAEAVRENNFGTIKCGNYEDAVKKDCGSTYSSVHMGAMTNAYMVEGNFYVPVNSEAPYGKIE